MQAARVTVVSALARELAVDPGRPLVTFYDGATGERIELSVKTFDNWVNKIANLLTGELSIEPGAGIRVQLPVHWQSTVTLVAAWAAGLRVLVDDASSAAEATVVGPAAASVPDAVDGQVIACSLRPLGVPFADPLPDGWLDFGLEVPSQPDALLAPVAVGPDDAAVVAAAGELSHGQLVTSGLDTAARLGLSSGGRLLTDANPCAQDGFEMALTAPLLSGCSVVLVANSDDAGVASIAEQERVTATAWASQP
jgi:uncharacterized protein (TIGR03089 family)